LFRRGFLYLGVALLGACAGSSSPSAPIAGGPSIELAPTGQGQWSAPPVEDNLDQVSNNGLGYTGEIDVYELTVPAPGRLQVALSWTEESDFDLILAADPEGNQKLATGQENDFEPEYVGLDVAGGQTVYLFVAGWEGSPGDYTLETILLPPGAPVFAVESLPDPAIELAANRPLRVRFNLELDPGQDLDGRIYIAGAGRLARGHWCVEGKEAVFFPDLPELPGESCGLQPGDDYILQILRGPRGPRAVTGEYTSELVGENYTVGPATDFDPAEPPRVTAVSPPPSLPWDGSELILALSEPLDPDTVFPLFFLVGPAGAETPIAFRFNLSQQYDCDGRLEARLSVWADEPIEPGSALRLVLPGTVLGLTGDPSPQNAIEGGAGFAVDFASR